MRTGFALIVLTLTACTEYGPGEGEDAYGLGHRR